MMSPYGGYGRKPAGYGLQATGYKLQAMRFAFACSL
jgi:hypothetical protein